MAQKTDSILWSKQRLLRLEDYKGKPDTSIGILAISYIGYEIIPIHKNDTITLLILNYFSPQESWFKKNSKRLTNKGTDLLKHEQGHFNINEIELRKLKKKLLSCNGLSYEEFKKQYKVLIKSYESDESKIQKQYDEETNLSRNSQKQKEWDFKFSKELILLEGYSNQVIKIPIKKNND